MADSSEIPCVHFSIQKYTGDDLSDIGHRPDGDRTAPARSPLGLRAAVKLLSSHKAVDVRFMPSFSFNHLLKTRLSIELRILNDTFHREREKEKMKKIQQVLWRYKCYLHFELMNYNEFRFQYTLLQYDYQIVKVYVCRPVAVWTEFTKSMPPGDLTVIGRCSDDDL